MNITICTPATLKLFLYKLQNNGKYIKDKMLGNFFKFKKN